MEMIERLAYYGVRVVMPIYIASAADPAGLHFTHVQKGTIFAWWAVAQSIVPVFSGDFSDRYGYKRTIALATAIKILGYVLMATQREFGGFLIGCLTLAFGTAIFKPGLQGTLAQGISDKNSALGWGLFFQVVNIGGFLGPPLAGILYDLSWPHVFYGCASVVSLNFLLLLTYEEVSSGSNLSTRSWDVVKLTCRELLRFRLLLLIFIMSGAWIMQNQLFDMLPNFIEDWVDTSDLIAALGLGAGHIARETSRGLQIRQEWLVNVDAGMIVLFMVSMALWIGRFPRLPSIVIGTIVASLGLLLSGLTTVGLYCFLGIVIFALGEMASTPRMTEYFATIAPPGKKALYLGYEKMPLAIGWFGGSLLAGSMYDEQGDKANLALRYLSEHTGMEPDVVSTLQRTEAMEVLQRVLDKTPAEVTDILWLTYSPYQVWFLFAAIGIASAGALAVFGRYARRWPDFDA